jgi:signal transduction histidine kinase/CheY-like chemotaxis protein
MKKKIIAAVVLVLVILCINIISIYRINKKHEILHNEMLLAHTQRCGMHIEKILLDYENELNRIIFNNTRNMHKIFHDRATMNDIIFNLQGFYKKYRNLLSNIAIYDNSNQYMGLYSKDNDEFVIDTFARQRNNVLSERQIIINQETKYLSTFPYFNGDELVGNIVAEINLKNFLLPLMDLYYIPGLNWQYLISSDTGILIYNGESSDFTYLDSIGSEIDNENEGLIHHESNSNDGKVLMQSAYYPLSVLNNDLAIVFSLNREAIISDFSSAYKYLMIANLVVIILIIYFTLVIHYNNENKIEMLSLKLLSYRMIIEQFPIGVMILKDGIIENINLTGQKMLFLNTDKGLIGKSFNEKFVASKNYLLKDNINTPFDSNHFLFYEKDGNEVVIYRKEVKTYIAGEELTLSALIDVSPFEKSRKQEAASNLAKSDFLEKMGEEIRNSMNGIVGLTDSLFRENLSNDLREKVISLKKSNALLMNVISDILDFSKIKAGNLLLEEIPFNLSDEINFTLSQFQDLALEKQIDLTIDINASVPSMILGDPFRLRQVISNLVSNSLRFTNEGKVNISVELLENYNNTVVLLFVVEDTGIGIEKDMMTNLFNSYENGNTSIKRNTSGSGLGLSIAKQLVEMMNGEIWAESPCNLSENNNLPGTKISFTIETHSFEKLEKKHDFSKITHYNQISAIILNKQKQEGDRMHVILDNFGISFNYRLYDEFGIDSVIKEFKENKNLYHIIIIKDKPEFDGFELSARLKAEKITDYYPVILITSNHKRGNYLKSKNLGIDYYIIQPYESIEFYEILCQQFPNIRKNKAHDSECIGMDKKLKILVVEDNIINQKGIQSLFKNLGYEIEIASNGSEALLKIEKETFDIIFMDLLMPEMDGFTASMEIRKKDKETP